jgi:serine/threonine protein kinase
MDSVDTTTEASVEAPSLETIDVMVSTSLAADAGLFERDLQATAVQFFGDGKQTRRAFETVSASIGNGERPFERTLLLVNNRGRRHEIHLLGTYVWCLDVSSTHPNDVQPSFAANSVCLRSPDSKVAWIVAHPSAEDQRGFLDRLCAAGCVMRDFVDHFRLLPADEQPPGEILLASPCSRRTPGEVVALKKASGNQRMPQLLYEVQVLLRLQHDGIIRAHGIYEVKIGGNKSYAMVLDYKSGGDLLSWIPQGGLGEGLVRELMTPLCDALVYLHELRVVHKDVKPSNVLCDRAGKDGAVKVVLADFEYAAHVTDKETLSKRCGTCGFVAPEMLRHEWGRLTQTETPSNLTKIDVFSFGMTLYGAVFGNNPFEDETDELTFQRNARCLISFANMGDRSVELRTLLEGLCASNPRNRLTSTAALAHPWFRFGLGGAPAR